MIRLKRIGLRNFLSFGNAWNYMPLDRPGVTLILGENLDVGDIGSRNGVGKTSILHAISVALYNDTLSDIRKDNWINATNKKGMEVILEFEKDTVEYKIHRGRKPDFVKLYRNGEDITPDSIINTNKVIEKILGIKFDLFRYVILFTASTIPFLDLSGPDQRTIIERLFDMDVLTAKALKAQEEKKELKVSIDMEAYKIKQTRDNNQRLGETIKKSQERGDQWETERKNKIIEIESKLKSLEGVDFEVEEKLHDDIVRISASVTNVVNNRESIGRSLKRLTMNLKTHNDNLVHLQDENCPFCLQGMPNAKDKITELNEVIGSIEDEQEDTALTYQDRKDKEQKLKNILEDLDSNKIHDNIRDLLDLRNESQNLKSELVFLETNENPHTKNTQELIDEGLKPIDEKKLEGLRLDFKHMDFLLKLLNDKNSFIRRRIISSVLPYMNSRIKHYLKVLGLPHRVGFEDNLTVSISQYGRQLDFGNLSTGERQRVNLALSFTFREVLGAMHTNFNILLLDEILDAGLDSVGVDNTIKALKQMGRDKSTSIFLISHRDEVSSRVNDTVIVKKEGGFSSITETSE